MCMLASFEHAVCAADRPTFGKLDAVGRFLVLSESPRESPL